MALFCFLGLLSTRSSRTFVKVPAFLFVKDHKKQEKVSGRCSAVVWLTEGSFLTDQYRPNQTRVNIFLLECNKLVLDVKGDFLKDIKTPIAFCRNASGSKNLKQRPELLLPCIFTYPCSVYQRVPQFEFLNSLYPLLTECKRLNVRWEHQAQKKEQ